MNRLHLSFGIAALVGGAVFACGGISDPRRGSENVSTISGELTGTSVPGGAHVALVWRNGSNGGFEVGSDAPIVDGRFTMSLGTPADAYFFPIEGKNYDEVNDGTSSSPPVPSTPPNSGSGGAAPPAPGGKQLNIGQKLAPRDQASGGITQPLNVALAGFVVYVDANGNGKLDIEGSHAGSPDQIIGGNEELTLAYLKGGGSLEYEKLRDKSGVLPVAGFNLVWEKGRFIPLNLVELKIASKEKLPDGVCSSASAQSGNTTPPTAGPAEPDTDEGGSNGYPSPTDPKVHCAADGRSYTYDYEPPNCPPPPPAGLCSGYSDAPSCAGAMPRMPSVAPGETPPAGWPCTIPDVKPPIDAGPAPDAGG